MPALLQRPYLPLALLLIGALAAGPAAPPPTATGPSAVPPTVARPAKKRVPPTVIESVAEAAISQPRIHVRLMDGKRALTAEPGLLAIDDKPVRSFPAYLDTGASGCLLGRETVKRFGVPIRPDALYHEVGLDGETTVGVSAPVTLMLADSSGATDEAPPETFRVMRGEAAFQLSRSEPQGLAALLGDLNVIGMPVIRRSIVEITPQAVPVAAEAEDILSAAGPSVRLHEKPFALPDCEFVIPLEYQDFNQRRHPGNRGSLPDLESNPMITGVITGDQSKKFQGDWLLDTGAAASLVSTKQAKALGLLRADGSAARAPDFSLPLGGVGDAGGEGKASPGYIIDRLIINANRNRAIEFHRVPVIVRDVGFKTAQGKEVALDGVFGMNMLLPAVSGMGAGKPGPIAGGAFKRIWIDGPRGVLALERR